MSVKIIECPRDAMQGLHLFIPTEEKVKYLKTLINVGFHTLDCGSFVSPRAIPQMRDTHAVLTQIEDKKKTKFSVIVANKRGIDTAVKEEAVDFLGFPFSISETFQRRNTNASIASSMDTVKYLMNECEKMSKSIVIYISMGFGNPYGDDWNVNMVTDYVGQLGELGIDSFSISDTVGVSKPESITSVYQSLFDSFKNIEFGAHFHTRKDNWKEKVESAYQAGCKRFDGAILGYGGCPMAKDELVGNMPTEYLIQFFEENNLEHGLNLGYFHEAMEESKGIFLNK